MDTLLVIGAESAVGANVACTLADAFSVVGLSRSADVELDGCRTIPCDFTEAELGHWIDETAPAWIVFSGALSRSSWDVTDSLGLDALEDKSGPRLDVRLAAEPPLAAATAAAAQRVGARLTFISTDAVFAGPQMFHAEESATAVTGPLSEAALAAEQAVLEAAPQALVVRTNAYGWGPTTHEIDFAERFWQALNDGLPVSADAHRHGTPILATDLAGLLHAAYRAAVHGVLHVAGAERTNPRRFAHELAGALGQRRRPHVAAAEIAWQRARETSLISRRAQQALGQPLPMLREGLRRFVAQLDNGYRDRVREEKDALVPAKAA
jgi:dTDP-4-dehydrorhamnose reductase